MTEIELGLIQMYLKNSKNARDKAKRLKEVEQVLNRKERDGNRI